MSSTEDEKTVADRVRKAMNLRGFTGLDLEDAAKLSKGYSSRILRGERRYLRSQQLERISAALRVSYNWLATGTGDMLDLEPRQVVAEQSPAELEEAIASGKWSKATVLVAREEAGNRAALTGERWTVDQWSAFLRKLESALDLAGVSKTAADDDAQRARTTARLEEETTPKGTLAERVQKAKRKR